jgi:4-carboxymuconolactone decarboxylase
MRDEVFHRGAEVLDRLSGGTVPPPWESFADIAPVLGNQVGHAFGAIMSRPGLDLRVRELLTVGVLAAIGGCEPQVAFHVGGALRAGATAAEVVETLTQVSVYAGVPRALNAVAAARPVFAEHGADPLAEAPRAVVAAFLDALADDDLPAALKRLSHEVTWRVPGDPEVVGWAGTWSGPDALRDLREMIEKEANVAQLDWGEPLPSGGSVYVPISVKYDHARRETSCAADFVLEFRVWLDRITEVIVHGDTSGAPLPE